MDHLRAAQQSQIGLRGYSDGVGELVAFCPECANAT